MRREEFFHESVVTLVETTHQIDIGGCGKGKVLEEFGFGDETVESQSSKCVEADDSFRWLPVSFWTGVD